MTVNELLNALASMPQDAEVRVSSQGLEAAGRLVEVPFAPGVCRYDIHVLGANRGPFYND